MTIVKKNKLHFNLLLGCLFVLLNCSLYAQNNDQNLLKMVRGFDAKNIYERPMGDRITTIGSSFIGEPYATGLLEGEPEILRYSLDKFDCVTFVETVVSLAKIKRGEKPIDEAFKSNLTKLRYQSEIVSYPTRRHYFSDWMKAAEKSFFLNQIIDNTISVKSNKTINFMSKHPESYPRLSDSEIFSQIKDYERLLTLEGFTYFPVEKYGQWKSLLNNGDIIAFVTNITGLDIAHVGFVVGQKGDWYLLNAPKPGSVVRINSENLETYLKNNPSYLGVMVGRVN